MAANNSKTSLPDESSFCDFQQNEVQNTTVGGAQGGSARVGLCQVFVPSNLKRRKIFCWVWVLNGNSYIRAKINFSLNGSIVGSLPVSGLNNTPPGLNESLINVCTTGGTAVGDTLGLYIANPADGQPTSLTLQPQYVYGEFDSASIQITDAILGTGGYARFFLGILSN